MAKIDPGSKAPTTSLHPDSSLTPTGRLIDFAFPAIILIVGLLLYLPWLGSYGPLDPTDSFFIESGREAFETNNYLLPVQNYKPWLDKPILYFWAVAGSYHMLGVNPFAGRLVSALSAVVLGLSTYFFSRPYIGRRTAGTAALIFMSFPLACSIGHLSLTDMPLAALMGLALQALFHFEKSRQVAACLIAYLTIMAIVNLPWYTMATMATNGSFLRDFFITQNFGRMAGVVNHQQPFWFYLPVLLGGLFPWSWLGLLFAGKELTPAATIALKAKAKTFLANRGALDEKNAYLVMNSAWAALVICLFSLIKTKLPTYILPALPALAVLFAVLLERLETKQSKILIAWGALITVTISGALAATCLTKGWVKLFLQNETTTLIAALVAAIICTILIVRKHLKIALPLLIGSTVIVTALLVPLAHIAFYKERQEPFEQLIKQIQNSNADIATVVVEAPSLSYFLHRHVDSLRTRADGQAYLSGGHYLLIPKEIPESLGWFNNPPLEIAKTKNGKWTLYVLY